VALEKELQTFNRLIPQLLPRHLNEWVLICEDEFDTWHCYQDAIKAGYQRFGLKPFLVKQLTQSLVQAIAPFGGFV
jgi:hypothetical protein